MTPGRFHLVLHEPVIPQNTGSIARLCACTGAVLHLIHPLGFSVDASAVKRAGLDYWEHVTVVEHKDWDAFFDAETPERFYFLSKFAKKSYVQIRYEAPTYLVLGSETKGLPSHLWERYPDRFLTLPMRTHLVRSLNLAQAAAVILYEALRQDDFSEIPSL